MRPSSCYPGTLLSKILGVLTVPGSGVSFEERGAVWSVPLVRLVFASLMLSQVPLDWIGTEVVFHSPVILRSCGESSRDRGGVCRLCTEGDLVLNLTGRDLCPWYGWFSASIMLSQV